MAEHQEFDFATAFDKAAELLADSIVPPSLHPLPRLLRDPVIAAAMAADGIKAETFMQLLRETAAKIRGSVAPPTGKIDELC